MRSNNDVQLKTRFPRNVFQNGEHKISKTAPTIWIRIYRELQETIPLHVLGTHFQYKFFLKKDKKKYFSYKKRDKIRNINIKIVLICLSKFFFLHKMETVLQIIKIHLLCVLGNPPVRNRVHHQTVHRVHALTFIFITFFAINIFKIFFLRIKVNEIVLKN